MTVLRRLADKGLVVQHRGDRAHRYTAVHSRDELVAKLMVDALDQVADSGDRRAAWFTLSNVSAATTCTCCSAHSASWKPSTRSSNPA
jgi:predicted transcriptional regulator